MAACKTPKTEYIVLVASLIGPPRVVCLLARAGWKPKLYKPVPESYRDYSTETISPAQMVGDYDLVIGFFDKSEHHDLFGFVLAQQKLDEAMPKMSSYKHLDTLNEVMSEAVLALWRMFLAKPIYRKALAKIAEMALSLEVRTEPIAEEPIPAAGPSIGP